LRTALGRLSVEVVFRGASGVSFVH
jgi:hypothetical protein